MRSRPISQVPLVDIHTRITKEMYAAIMRECADCTCGISAFLRVAIGHELSRRSRERKIGADSYIDQIAAELEREARSNA